MICIAYKRTILVDKLLFMNTSCCT